MTQPTKVVLTMRGEADNFRVDAEVDGAKHKLGRVFVDEDAEGWTIDSNDGALTAEGRFEVIGMMLDELLDPNDIDDEDEDEDEDNEDLQEDEDDDGEDGGRAWQVVSRTRDSVTMAMQIDRETPHGQSPAGCLVRVEIWDADEQSQSSVVFVPAVSLDDLRKETHPQEEAAKK